MRIELEKYRLEHLPYDELGVLAAFLKLPCVYGVPGRWIKKGYGSLEDRALRIAGELERKGRILAEPGGIVRMDETAYRLITAMGRSERLARVSWGAEDGPERLYLYRFGDGVVTAEQDGRGGCYLGRLSSPEELKNALTGAGEAERIDTAPFGRAKSWLGALAFEKRDSLCRRILDFAWSEERGAGLTDGWERLCRVLWDSTAGGEEQDA